MNSEKSNKSLITLVIVFVITTIIFGGYIVYDKLFLANNKEQNELTNNNEPTDNNNITSYNNVSINLEQLQNYKNYSDNSYGDIDYFYSNEVRVYLSANGKVRMIKDGENSVQYITNLENVIDILEINNMGDVTYYFLLKDGSVYNYDLVNYNNDIFTATKNDNVSNVQRILYYSYAAEPNTEFSHLVIGITNTGDNVIIK